jgi:hypothetical protein
LARYTKNKYMNDKAIGQVQRKPGDSQFWAGLMNVKECFLGFGTFRVNNGRNIRFWGGIFGLGIGLLRSNFLSYIV